MEIVHAIFRRHPGCLRLLNTLHLRRLATILARRLARQWNEARMLTYALLRQRANFRHQPGHNYQLDVSTNLNFILSDILGLTDEEASPWHLRYQVTCAACTSVNEVLVPRIGVAAAAHLHYQTQQRLLTTQEVVDAYLGTSETWQQCHQV